MKSQTSSQSLRVAQEEIARLKKALEHSIGGLVITDSEGKILFVNTQWADLHGYTPTELLGTNVARLCNPPLNKLAMKAFLVTVAKDEQIEKEVDHLDKSGKPVFLWVRIKKTVQGSRINFVWTAISIDKQKQVELRLIKKTKELEKINTFMIGRELRMRELKQRNKKLKEALEKIKKKSSKNKGTKG